jgi:hypothetical protein
MQPEGAVFALIFWLVAGSAYYSTVMMEAKRG